MDHVVFSQNNLKQWKVLSVGTFNQQFAKQSYDLWAQVRYPEEPLIGYVGLSKNKITYTAY